MTRLVSLIILLFSQSALAAEVTQCDVLNKSIAEDAQIIDVRSSVEFKLGHVPGAVLIPHKTLASRIDELDKSKPIIVYCHSGYRAGIAEQILKENGFDKVSQLQGHWTGWDTSLQANSCPE